MKSAIKPHSVQRNKTPNYSSSNSNNNNLIKAITKQLQNGVNVNTNNPQLITPNLKVRMNIKGNNNPWVIYRILPNNKTNKESLNRPRGRVMSEGIRRGILSADPNASKPNFPSFARGEGSMSRRSPGRRMTPEESRLTKQLSKLRKRSMVLYHSSPHSLNTVQLSNIILSPTGWPGGFFHTNPNWTYHGDKKKTLYELHIPVNIVKQHAIQSMAEFQPNKKNSTKGYSTLILPRTKSMVVNIENTNGVKKITSVFRKI